MLVEAGQHALPDRGVVRRRRLKPPRRQRSLGQRWTAPGLLDDGGTSLEDGGSPTRCRPTDRIVWGSETTA